MKIFIKVVVLQKKILIRMSLSFCDFKITIFKYVIFKNIINYFVKIRFWPYQQFDNGNKKIVRFKNVLLKNIFFY